MTPTSPAHWLAVNLERQTPTPAFPPIAMAAANGSLALAISDPYLIADYAVFIAIPEILVLIVWGLSTLFFSLLPKVNDNHQYLIYTCLFTLIPHHAETPPNDRR